MLKSVEQLQTGLISSKSFQVAATTNRIFDMQLSKFCKVERFHNSGINSLDIDRIEERYLLSGGKNGAICIHDLQNFTGKLCNTAKAVCKVKSGSQHAHRFSVITVQWYPFDTGIFITSGMDNKLKLWDTNSMRPADTIPLEYKASCHNMSTISTQHSLIAVALGYPHVVLLDPRTGSRCHELRGHHNAVSYVRWSPVSEYLLASGGIDNRILLWDIRSAKGYLRSLDQHNGEAIGNRKDLKTAHDGSIVCMRFTDDGLYLVSYGSDCNIRVWDVAMSKNTLVNFGTLYDNTVIYTRSMDLCCDSSPPTLFIPCNNFLYAYDLFNGCRIKNFVGHFSSVNSCVFRNSSHHLYSAGNDMNILIWTPDVEREEEEHLSRKESQKKGQNVDSDEWSSDEES